MAHILIVDDEEQIRFLIRTALESGGHAVFEARDAQSALDILETHPDPFDMIILDIRMPDMDGFEFLSILQDQPICPPVIILSAHSGEIPPALASMVIGRFRKPFRRQELNDTVNSFLAVTTTAV